MSYHASHDKTEIIVIKFKIMVVFIFITRLTKAFLNIKYQGFLKKITKVDIFLLKFISTVFIPQYENASIVSRA